MDEQDETYESNPADYGYGGGFEDWDDFNNYCDEFERGLDWE